MTNGFSGDVAEYYARYRRGYPSLVIDGLVKALGLSGSDTIVDLGCGSGQLTLPLAQRVGRVIGVEPEADMLRHARTAEHRSGTRTVKWILGTSDDLEAISAQYGPIDAVTLANVVHLLDRAQLFADAPTALRPGGALVIIANGTPLWLQDAGWSRAVRIFLERWLGTDLVNHCGTDDDSRSVYRNELTALGYGTDELRVGYSDLLTLDQIVGGVFSAMSDRLPAADDRSRFASELARALVDEGPYTEHVSVRTLIGRVR